MDWLINSNAAVTVTGALLGVVGTLVAAGIALGGLLWTFRHERRERAEERFDRALQALMEALGRRAEQLDEWVSTPSHTRNMRGEISTSWPKSRDRSGGPLDADVQTAADVAHMLARGDDQVQALATVAETIYMLKRGRIGWQIGTCGQIVGDIRKWRSGKLSTQAFHDQMKELTATALAHEDALARESV
ncbi:hypothetical protein [Salinibacterium sp. ZJ450]|uniref:hypothetical protein n=1 Tax=Salinibacterium sp. ZJ450 TaxID=2708338 RepID=UPI001422C39F|nr:hypothetical protein [Salinibacterium sp. ZJ450]